MSQPVLPLLPADATPIGPVAGLVDGPEGGVVFVSGLAAFAFAAGDEVGRRRAAVQLVTTKIASAVEVAGGFGVGVVTLWRWKSALEAHGVAGLIPARTGPKRASKLTDAVVARIQDLDAQGLSLAAVGAAVGVSTATVRVALGRSKGSAGWEARRAAGADDARDEPAGDDEHDEHARDEHAGDGRDVLPVLPMPKPRTRSARWRGPGCWCRRRWCSPRARICRWRGCC